MHGSLNAEKQSLNKAATPIPPPGKIVVAIGNENEIKTPSPKDLAEKGFPNFFKKPSDPQKKP